MKPHHPTMSALLAALILTAGIAGCTTESKEASETSEAGAVKTAPAHGAGMTPSASVLKFKAPQDWITETPSSSMRQAQYRLPRVSGDTEDAELAVFFFGGSGGSVQANIDRWIGQFQKPDGSPATGTTSRREVHGIPLTIVDVSGVYLATGGPMMTETAKKPDFRMLAAVAESSNGPWFFKLTGPAKTVAKWEPSFQSFLDTIR